MAANTDKLRKKKSLFSTTLNGAISDSDATIALSSASGLPTDTAVTLTIDRVDANANSTPALRERITGVVVSNNVTNSLRGQDGSSAQAHNSGAVVEDIWEAETWNDLIDAMLVEHDQDGTHGAITGSSLVASGNITGANLKLAAAGALLDANDNELAKFTQTASAVNEITIANAATGNSPIISATGGDTDVGIKLTPKGAGKVEITLNDLKIPTAGNIQPNGADPTRALYVAASAMYPSTTAGCAALAQVESTTNKVNVKVLDFDGAGTAKEYAEFGIQLPTFWDLGTITAQFVWLASAGSGTVLWGLQAGAFSDDDAIDTAYGTAQEVTDTLLATGDVHISAETAAITIAGTPAAGDWINFRVYRDPNNDTNTSDARLLGVRLRFKAAQYNDA